MAKESKISTREKGRMIAENKDYRREIFLKLCRHVERGFSLDCFEDASDDSIRKYLKDYKEEWCEEELAESMRKGKGLWEGIGFRQANGECLGNSRSWYYNMANRYGWREKIDIEAEHRGQVAINVVSYASQRDLQVDEKGSIT